MVFQVVKSAVSGLTVLKYLNILNDINKTAKFKQYNKSVFVINSLFVVYLSIRAIYLLGSFY